MALPVKKLAPTLKVNKPIGKKQATSINTPKYVILANKKIAPKAVILKVILKTFLQLAALLCANKSATKPLELAMISATLLQYLTKQKNVEIFGISMRDLVE